MNPLIVEIIGLGIDILRQQFGGPKIDTPAALVSIFQKANAAYQAEVGMPIDPSKIQPIEPV